MKNNLFLVTFLLLILGISNNLQAGNSKKCASADVLQRQMDEDPKFRQNRDKLEQFTKQYISNQQNSANRNQLATVTIPVVFHVVYNTTEQNVSNTQLTDQIARLNADYGGTNTDVSQIPSAFQGVKAGNTNIQFCLAQQDPSGNATTGIIRIPTSVTSFSDDDAVKSSTTGGSNPWNTSKYLNIWICNLGNDLLGYAQFPGGPGSTDGVVILYSSLPGGSAPYNLGRTATHEVGHWLNLSHIWGDSFCGDDEVSDTPTQFFSNSGCPTYPHVTCSNGPNGDMFMNYMDYTNDACMFMFSAGQSARMNAIVTTGGPRVSLATSNGCTPPGPSIPVANFSADRTTVCPGSSVKFTDLSTGTPTSWSWSFAGGTPATVSGTNAASQNPTITYSSAGTFAVTLTATNGLGSDGETKTGYITVANPTTSALPFSEGFQSTTFPPTGWSLSLSTFNWQRTAAAGGFGGSSASMYFNNYDNDAAGQKSDIVSPVINLNGATTPRLRFDVAYAPYLRTNGSSKYDTLEVLITDYCANTTTSIYKKGGTQLATVAATTNAFLPTAAQWRKDSVSIPGAYLNKNVKITFRNYGLYANNIYVDNINLYSVSATTPTATASFTASDTVVCIGGSLTFTNTSTATSGSPDSVRWTLGGGTPSTSASTTTVSPVFNSVGNFTISLIAYKSGNASVAATKSIRVKAKPIVTVNSPSICSGLTANLTASGASTYTWSPNIGTIATVTTPALTTTSTYTVTGTTSGCTNTATSTVSILPLPTVSVITGATTICTGTTSTLSSSPSGGTWLSSNTAIAQVNASGVVTGVSAGTANIYYTVTGANTCQKSVATTVTINPTPTVTVNSPTICSGSTATLTASGATSYSWTGGLGTGNPKTTPALTTTTTYTVTGTTGSCTKTAVATVTVSSSLNITVNSPTICAGSTATLTASGATSYSWTGGLGTGNPKTTSALTTTTTYTVTGSSGSCSNTAVAIVTVNPVPNVTVNSPSICAGQSTTITASGASSYTWTGGLASVSNPTAGPLTTTTTYTVTGSSGSCSNTAVAIVTVNPVPNVTVNSPSICAGQSTTITASGASSYTWTGGLASVSNPTAGPLTTTTTYTVTGTTGNCNKTAIATVTVKLLPPTPIITQRNDTLFCSTIGGASYNWYRNNVFLVTTNVANLKITQSGTYSVEVVGTNTCTSVRSANFNGTYTATKNNKLDIIYAIVPNPNNGLFELNITSGTNKTYQLKLYSVSGQIIMEDQINLRIGQNNKRINVFGIEKGVYFLSVISDEGLSTQSVLIQ